MVKSSLLLDGVYVWLYDGLRGDDGLDGMHEIEPAKNNINGSAVKINPFLDTGSNLIFKDGYPITLTSQK